MDVFEAIERRHSVRRFERRDVPEDVLERLLAAAVRAPTAGNLQPWRFIIVRDPSLRNRLVAVAGGQGFVGDAPVVIAVCADLDVARMSYGSRGEELYAIQDTAAAVENLMLAAVSHGLGTCWVGAFDEDSAAQVLAVEDRWRVLALVPIGYPSGQGLQAPRVSLRHVVRFR